MRTICEALISVSVAASITMIGLSAAAGPLPVNKGFCQAGAESSVIQAGWVSWGGAYPFYGYPSFYAYDYYPSGYGAYGYSGPYSLLG
jgi:hypothetical protein